MFNPSKTCGCQYDGVIVLGSALNIYIFFFVGGGGWGGPDGAMCVLSLVFSCKALPYFGILFFSWEKGGRGPHATQTRALQKSQKRENRRRLDPTRAFLFEIEAWLTDFDWVLVSPPPHTRGCMIAGLALFRQSSNDPLRMCISCCVITRIVKIKK